MPSRVHYRLTDLGLSLEGPPAMVRSWAEEHTAEIDRANQLSQELAADG